MRGRLLAGESDGYHTHGAEPYRPILLIKDKSRRGWCAFDRSVSLACRHLSESFPGDYDLICCCGGRASPDAQGHSTIPVSEHTFEWRLISSRDTAGRGHHVANA